MVMLLLNANANIESKDGDGWTPLWQAAWKGHKAIFKLPVLLEAKADVESKIWRWLDACRCRPPRGGTKVSSSCCSIHSGKIEIDSKDKYGPDAAVVGRRGTVQSHRQAAARYGQGRGRRAQSPFRRCCRISPRARTKV